MKLSQVVAQIILKAQETSGEKKRRNRFGKYKNLIYKIDET